MNFKMSNRELFVHLDSYNRVADMFRAESDRAAAIVGTSYLDGLLEKLLKLKLVQNPKMDLFSRHGPLATFRRALISLMQWGSLMRMCITTSLSFAVFAMTSRTTWITPRSPSRRLSSVARLLPAAIG